MGSGFDCSFGGGDAEASLAGGRVAVIRENTVSISTDDYCASYATLGDLILVLSMC